MQVVFKKLFPLFVNRAWVRIAGFYVLQRLDLFQFLIQVDDLSVAIVIMIDRMHAVVA